MRQIKNQAMALALIGVLAACSDDRAATDPVANEDNQTTSSSPTPSCRAVGFHHDALDPGCWSIQVRGRHEGPLAELNLPAGFSGNDAWVWANTEKENQWGALTLLPVGDVYSDPCTRAGGQPKIGPSVADFAEALGAQTVTTTTAPVPVSVDGHDGVYLELSLPARFDTSSCRGEELILWDTGAGGDAVAGADIGVVNRYWVLDLDGQRMVVSVATTDDATDQTVDLFTGIAEAATFDEG